MTKQQHIENHNQKLADERAEKREDIIFFSFVTLAVGYWVGHLLVLILR